MNTMVIINKGRGPHGLKGGKVINPGESAEVSVEEGAELLGYKHMVDAAKSVPAYADRMEALEKENAELKAELALLKAAQPVAPAPSKKGKKDAE